MTGTIAHLIAEHRAEILDRWRTAARQFESARGLSESELVGVMPAFLRLLGMSRIETYQLSEAALRVVEQQVSNRLRQGFLLNDILNDFRILCRCIEDATELVRSDSMGARIAQAQLLHELNLTLVAATSIFSEHMMEDEQIEKRYGRLIVEAASASDPIPGAGAPVLRHRLRTMLEVIMRAVGADTAALLLHDETSQRLVISASAGEADEVLEHFVSSLDPSTFPGMVASRSQQATFADIETTELTLSDALAQSGIRSLMGVRLSSHGRLRAVVYVGTRATRTFSASDVRRLEALGDVLMPQIDRAKLHDDMQRLSQRIDEVALVRPPAVPTSTLHELGATLTVARANAAQLVDGEATVDHKDAASALGRDLEHMDQLLARLLARPREALRP